MSARFKNRKDAGRLLAQQVTLNKVNKDNSIILALPRGGVPVAFELATALEIPMEVLIVRKIGHPHYEEYGIGATTEDGFYWLNPDSKGLEATSAEEIQGVVKDEQQEVQRRVKKYRDGKPLPTLKGKNIILVDDGLATGVTARVGIQYLQNQGAEKITLAIPVGAKDTVNTIRASGVEVVCLNEVVNLMAVGIHYEEFYQTSDEEVLELLARGRQRPSKNSLPGLL